MMNEPFVRVGTPADLKEVMRLAALDSLENAIVEPDPYKFVSDVEPALHLDRGVVGVIGGGPGEHLEAFILLKYASMWYSNQLHLEERIVFVDPEYRSAKGGRARKLVEFAKNTADRLGLHLSIGVLSNKRTEAKIRLYERMFGKPVGVYFMHTPKIAEG